MCLNFMNQGNIVQAVGVVELWYILCGLSLTNAQFCLCECVVELLVKGKGNQLRWRVGREPRGWDISADYRTNPNSVCE